MASRAQQAMAKRGPEDYYTVQAVRQETPAEYYTAGPVYKLVPKADMPTSTGAYEALRSAWDDSSKPYRSIIESLARSRNICFKPAYNHKVRSLQSGAPGGSRIAAKPTAVVGEMHSRH
jgi:hypothetical protein